VTDTDAEIVAVVELVVRHRRAPYAYTYYGARGDPRWPLNTRDPRNTLHGFLLTTTEWRLLQLRLRRRLYHGETTRAIAVVLTALLLEDA
jgi:hypothetical protein